MKTFAETMKTIDRILTAILKWLTVTLFLVLTAIVTANILLRIFPITSLHWMDEIVEMCFAGMVFYGAAGVWIVKGHFSVGDWIGKRVKNPRTRGLYRLLVELISLLFVGILFKYSLELTLRAHEVSAVFQIPKKVFYSAIPVSALIMVIYSAIQVVVQAIEVVRPKQIRN
jgi:TRAP-type C4-dicarboxylate transport system permease small subunit